MRCFQKGEEIKINLICHFRRNSTDYLGTRVDKGDPKVGSLPTKSTKFSLLRAANGGAARACHGACSTGHRMRILNLVLKIFNKY